VALALASASTSVSASAGPEVEFAVGTDVVYEVETA
jgi:hypothetical protein